MRKLASVVKIDQLYPIEGADRIVRATMVGKGWNVVVANGEFKTGDLAVYMEIDSYLPADDARYEFLRDRCLRKFVSKSGTVLREGLKIKTIKLKGVVSQGLLIPLDKFPEITGTIEDKPDGKTVFKNVVRETTKDENDNDVFTDVQVEEELLGADVSYLLKVEHYDEVKEMLTPQTGAGPISADMMGKFPSDYMPKTDEERIQNLAGWITKYADRKWELTSKDDGSSCTMFYSPTVDETNPFGVCSRNNRLMPVTEKGVVPMMWLLAKKYLVEEKLKELYEKEGLELAFQGEALAPGLQGNRDKYTEPEWHVFRIWNIKEQKFLQPAERRALCKRLNIPHVQVIAEEMPVFQVHTSVDAILKFAEGKTARGNEREGIVFKSSDGLEPVLSFKAVSNRYLLRQED